MSAINNTIKLQVSSPTPDLELVSSDTTAITPGMLLRYHVDIDHCKLHDDANGRAYPIFAVENIFSGKEIDDTYALNERVMCNYMRPGDHILAWLGYDPAPQTVGMGDYLASNGDGTLKLVQATPEIERSVIAVALTALTTTVANRRIRVSIL